ncbi:MAG TPA: RdgB/HAM1 family non-canonical purine NTP pyrophosphatase [Pyrinomonadaceae bacterium]|nr:RdgB/HAM1 family non-canonical purine NTP pyrophosphatase [Pyrinomonadaceae bacterium]
MSQQTLVIATRNSGKLFELRELLRDLPLTLCDLNSFPSIESVEETGATFSENACVKARAYAEQTRSLVLADDSGLEVSSLGGAPGVYSARYAGDGASEAQRTEKLLAVLSKSPDDRAARFVSAVAIANSDGRILNVSVGVCEGHIANAPRGPNGFGYDPVFIPDGYGQTFGELSADVKNQISHRARALKGALVFLRSLTMASGDG